MAGALINITDAGRAALVAPGNTGTNAHRIFEIGLSTALFDATDRTLKKLPNELKRITTFGGDNVAADTIHVTLRDDTPDQYKLYGLGLYLENGVLFGVYCQKAEDGPIMEKSPAALLLLSADMQFVTIDAAQLVFGNASFTNPPATIERQGVVELATQDEVNAGADNSRAITPKTAAARFAALTGATFSGPIILAEGSVSVPSLTFDKDGAPDTGLYHISDGSFGVTSNGKSVARFTPGGTVFDKGIQVAAGVRALFGTTTDDGTNLVQIGGNANTRGVHTFGLGATVGWATSDTTIAYFRSNGHVSVGSESAAGYLDLFAGNVARARVLPNGRILVGTVSDDGASAFQVNGIVKGIASVRALSASNGGGTGQTSIMLTREGAPTDEKQWEIIHTTSGALSIRTVNDAYSASKSVFEIVRPTGGGITATLMKLMLDGGRVLVGTSIDDGNSRLQVSGHISVNRAAGEGQLALGGNDGYFYGNALQCGWYSPTKGAFRYDFTTQNLYVGAANNAVWHAGNLPNPLDKSGGMMAGQLLLAEGSVTGPSLSFVNDGTPDTGLFHIADGVFGITCNGVEQVRFGTSGIAFAKRPTFAGATPWDTANFTPGNYIAKGGDTMTGRLNLTMPNSGGELGLRSTDGTYMFLRGRGAGGGMEWINSAYNNIVARMDDGGNFTSAGSLYAGNGSGILATDGNVYGGVWGGWLSNWLNSTVNNLQNNINGKANNGAQCQWSSGVVEFGAVNIHNEGTADLGNPWVMVGLRRVGDGFIYIRGTWLRNQ
uniref:hypothetical protein n=1 Tax=Paraburkholderia nemoris TaxID=2793076 RepID=UPI0038BA76F5